jgi:hypothetical protein
VQGDKLALQIHSATLTAVVVDTCVPLDSLPKPKPGEGGVPRASRQPKDGPKPESSLVGRWDVTFKNGATAVLTFEPGGQFGGTNGTWTQTGAKFRISTAAVNGGKELVWDGEIAADGKTLTATSSAGGTASGTRK